MKPLPKNLLSIIKLITASLLKQKRLLPFLLFKFNLLNSQIANYVNNGSFELCAYCTSTPQIVKPKYWDGIDTTKYCGYLLSSTISPYSVPISSFTYQWPKSGNNYFLSTLYYKPNSPQTVRGYPRNTLKQTLQAGTTYCVKFYCSVTNQSTYGVDGLGAYFGDSSIDTITYCSTPISYLIPQVQNPTNNLLTDTLNWIQITGTFVATGSEKYLMLGNFKSDVATNSVLINPANLPIVGCEVVYDDVSCIPLNLPAYAGPDIWGIPTTTVYLGRSQDVGIDEACMWYKLPNTTNAIDTAAGITITVAATTETYMVKQDICGVIKYDTVVVHPSALGNEELRMKNEEFEIYPNPTNGIFYLNYNNLSTYETYHIKMLNVLGQEVYIIKNNNKIDITNVKTGVYFLQFYQKDRFISAKKIIKE